MISMLPSKTASAMACVEWAGFAGFQPILLYFDQRLMIYDELNPTYLL